MPRFFLNPSLYGFASGRRVTVVDLSVRGARLEVIEPVEPGRKIFLSILSRGEEVSTHATVLWCQLDSLQLNSARDTYLVGVAFEKVSPSIGDLIDELSERGEAVRIEDARHFDRYYLAAPLTASFAEFAPVSIVDLSVRGAGVVSPMRLVEGHTGQLTFQIDQETGPMQVMATSVWAAPTVGAQFQAGLLIPDADEVMRVAIHRLCWRGEARIDLDSLRKKFDAMRAQARRRKTAGAA